MVFKTGKRAFRKDRRDLKWRDYIDRTALPPLPKPPFGHADLVKNWLMLANDQLGDCVIAGQCHDAMLDNAEAGNAITFTDQNAIDAYSAACGYNPNDPNSDQGCDIRSVLKFCQQTGLKDASGNVHKIDAFVSLDQTNMLEIYESIYLFGKAKLGVQLPQSAIDQTNNGQPWTVVSGSPVLGGHDVEVVEVLENGDILVITWGQTQVMTQAFFSKYCDEAWSPLSKEMLTNKGISLEGFNWEQLTADLAAITGMQPPAPAALIPTHLAVDPISGQTGGRVNLIAELIDTKNSIPAARKRVQFSINGIHAGDAVTNPRGFAVLQYNISQPQGSYQISSTFAGDDAYASTSGGNSLVVTSNPPAKDPLSVIKQIQTLVKGY